MYIFIFRLIDFIVRCAFADSTWNLPSYGWWKELIDFLLWLAGASVPKWTHPKPVNSSKFHKVMARLCTAIPHQLQYFSTLHLNSCCCLNTYRHLLLQNTSKHDRVIWISLKAKFSADFTVIIIAILNLFVLHCVVLALIIKCCTWWFVQTINLLWINNDIFPCIYMHQCICCLCVDIYCCKNYSVHSEFQFSALDLYPTLLRGVVPWVWSLNFDLCFILCRHCVFVICSEHFTCTRSTSDLIDVKSVPWRGCFDCC